MAKQKWDKRTLKLPEKHGWHARPGTKIFVADRGAVRLDFPDTWVVIPDPDSIKFHDKTPPDDDCTLALSVMRLPPDVDWSGLRLGTLVGHLIEKDSREITSRGEVVEITRLQLELAWAEVRFTDPTQENRPARSRICLARNANVQPLITFDFWEDDAARFTPVWDDILRSLRVGEPILDPRLGQPNRG
jgi:hypothetical protein